MFFPSVHGPSPLAFLPFFFYFLSLSCRSPSRSASLSPSLPLSFPFDSPSSIGPFHCTSCSLYVSCVLSLQELFGKCHDRNVREIVQGVSGMHAEMFCELSYIHLIKTYVKRIKNSICMTYNSLSFCYVWRNCHGNVPGKFREISGTVRSFSGCGLIWPCRATL